VPWPAVDELVRGSIQRSYLKRYRWWLELVLAEFSFLEPLGYSLPPGNAKGVKFHQKGNYVWFTGPGRDVVIEYDPESSHMSANLWQDDPSPEGRFLSLDAALIAAGATGAPPSRSPLDQAAVAATVAWWATGLRASAGALLALGSSRDIQRR
jgi:hypothetical protein